MGATPGSELAFASRLDVGFVEAGKIGFAIEMLRGTPWRASGISKAPVEGDVGGLGLPDTFSPSDRNRLSLVLALRNEPGATNAGSVLRAAASIGLEGVVKASNASGPVGF